MISVLYGKGPLAANVIWMRGFDEEVRSETSALGGSGSASSSNAWCCSAIVA